MITRARTLVDQYRKKAELYKTNVVLIPLGDDFRYDKAREWDRQYPNYEKLIKQINSDPSINAEAQFGTLEDYFNALREESKKKSGTDTGLFKSLSGDFFTYADRDDHYWSGYYTSRPFYKNMDRILEGYLRGAEILYSLMWAEMEYVGTDLLEIAKPLFDRLIMARESLSLFQHHDGVTGTAKNHVMEDYGKRMLDSINGLQVVMSQATHYLLTPSKSFYKPSNEIFYDLDDQREHHSDLPKQHTIQIEEGGGSSKVVIYNSHAKKRSEVVTFKVSLANVKVYRINTVDGDEEEEVVQSQLSPVFEGEGDDQQILNNEFYLSFLAQVKGLGLQTYFIKQLKPEEGVNT